MPRGGKRAGAGRPRGSQNRVTREVRAALKTLVEDNVGEMQEWFKRQWKSDDGGKVAANLLSRLIEFAAPKLQRAEAPPPGAELLSKPVDEMSDAELEAVAGSWKDARGAMKAYDSLVSGVNPVPRNVQDELLRRMSHEEREDATRNVFLALDGDLDEYRRATCRVATAADFGLPEPEPPRPALLCAPAQLPDIPVQLRDPVPIEAPPRLIPQQSEPIEGEVISAPIADQLNLTAHRRALKAKQERDAALSAEYAAWEQRRDEEIARIAKRLGCPPMQVAPSAWLPIVGKPPTAGGWMEIPGLPT